MASSCSEGLKCFKCNTFGHIATNCSGGVAKLSSASTSGTNTTGETSNRERGRSVSRDVGGYGGGGRSDRRALCAKINSESNTEIDNILLVKSEKCNGNTELQFQSESERMKNDRVNVYDCCQMSSVNKVPYVNKSLKIINISGLYIECLIDSGSDLNLVSSDLFFELNVTNYIKERNVLSGLGATKITSLGKFNTQFEIDGQMFDQCFHIVKPNVIPYKIILGQPFLLNNLIIMDKGSVTVASKRDCDLLQNMVNYVQQPVCYVSNPQIQQIIQDLVENYKPVQTKEVPIEMKIILKDDIPIAQRPRRLSFKEQQEVEKQTGEWLERGIIRPSFSEYASPLVLVKKKDGTTRVCVDYRLINKKMVKDELKLIKCQMLKFSVSSI